MKRLVGFLSIALALTGCLCSNDEPGIYHVGDWEAFTEAVNTGAPLTAWEDGAGVVRLRNDLNLKRWKNPRPAGADSSTPFQGVFDGGNHTISGLKLTSDNAYVGLFGINRGTIRRLKLHGKCRIENTNAEGVVGAVCGENYGRVEHCENEAEVRGAGCVGGLVGHMQSDPATTTITLIARCQNLGAVISTGACAGGIVGRNSNAKVVDSDNVGPIIGKGDYAGGIVGLNGGSIRNCENLAPIQGRAYAGGIAGANKGNGTFNEVSNQAPIRAETIGEIVGEDRTNQLVDEDTLQELYHREAE